MEEDTRDNKIKASKICLILFCQRYAASRLWLDDLVTILNCENNGDMIVLPVFYRIDPSVVQKLRHEVGENLAENSKHVHLSILKT